MTPLRIKYSISARSDRVSEAELDQAGATAQVYSDRRSGPCVAGGDLSNHDVYLCASPRLAARVRESLRDRGFPRHQLHEERFSF